MCWESNKQKPSKEACGSDPEEREEASMPCVPQKPAWRIHLITWTETHSVWYACCSGLVITPAGFRFYRRRSLPGLAKALSLNNNGMRHPTIRASQSNTAWLWAARSRELADAAEPGGEEHCWGLGLGAILQTRKDPNSLHSTETTLSEPRTPAPHYRLHGLSQSHLRPPNTLTMFSKQP